MISKILISGYSDKLGLPSSVLLPRFSNGFDKSALRKCASSFTPEQYNSIDKKPGTAYIHLISVAAGETYGPNSRADYYNGDPFTVNIPHPEKDAPAAIDLDGGISKYHDDTFMKEGAVYRNHKNKHDGVKSCGTVEMACYNKPMKRGELIIGVPEDKWSTELTRLEKGDPLKFSIGADTPYDICTYCGHKARTESGHCDHYKHQRGQMAEDGTEIAVITDKAVYHDISLVPVPAERIAFSIRRVASADDELASMIPEPPQAKSLDYILCPGHSRDRFNALRKLAKIEKTIIAMASNKAIDPKLFKASCGGMTDESISNLKKFLSYADHNKVLGCLNDHHMLLGPDDFFRLMMPADMYKTYASDKFNQCMPGIFENILNGEDLQDFCEDDMFKPERCGDANLHNAVINCGSRCSTLPSSIIGNVMDSCGNVGEGLTPSNKTIILIKKADGLDRVQSILAHEYASYVVSAAASNMSQEEMAVAVMRSEIM